MQTKIITARQLRDGDTIIEKLFGRDTEFYVEQAESASGNQVKAINEGRTSFFAAADQVRVFITWT